MTATMVLALMSTTKASDVHVTNWIDMNTPQLRTAYDTESTVSLRLSALKYRKDSHPKNVWTRMTESWVVGLIVVQTVHIARN